jgi:tetratricopeptide (TPR) repeat protein
MKIKYLLIIVFLSLVSVTQTHACGNQYYYRDQPLPRGNGFLDYYRLFISTADTNDRSNYKRDLSFPYLYPMEGLQTKSSYSRYQDVDFNKLYDTIIKLAGSPKNAWKLGYQEIGMRAYNRNGDYKLLSDFAWKIAQKGEITAALTMLSALVKKYPNEYNILANLGTVYELSGKPRSALDYLSRAIKVSPESHYGSEWIHIHILQIKLGEKNSYDLTGFFAMDKSGTPYSDQLYSKTINPAQMGHFHRDTLMVHLAYQLHERMYFITAKDELMGEMLYMFLQCMIMRGDKAYAAEAASLCIRYLPVNKREKVFKALAWAMRG